MERTDDRFLPVLLLGVQAVVWPGSALLVGSTPTAADLLATALVGGLVTAALAARRTRPVPVLVLVAAACAVGSEPLPTGAVAVLGTAGVALALFTVAAERDTTTGLLCVATPRSGSSYTAWAARAQPRPGPRPRPHRAALRGGHRCRPVRAAATGRPAGRRAAAAPGRDRAAPAPGGGAPPDGAELHDVSAHHLTAVVVTVEAALGLRERRPNWPPRRWSSPPRPAAR
ncbi:hypothetical protein NKH77_08515 [Streptomyces sp. M19]